MALHDFFFKLTAVKHCRCLEHRAFFSEEDERNTRNERGFCVTYEYVGPLAIENGEKKHIEFMRRMKLRDHAQSWKFVKGYG